MKILKSFKFTFKIQAFSSKLLSRFRHFFQDTSKFRHFLPRYVQDQTFSSKLLPRSGIFFQVTSKIRYFFPSYFQDQIFFCKILQDQTFSYKILQDQTFSCKILQDQTFSCKILQDQTFSCKIFQDTCKNNALSSKILEVKSDRFLQKMYGGSTRALFRGLNKNWDYQFIKNRTFLLFRGTWVCLGQYQQKIAVICSKLTIGYLD